MEIIDKIREITEKMCVDGTKAMVKGNKRAATRARKYAQEIRAILPVFRKEVSEKQKNHIKNDVNND